METHYTHREDFTNGLSVTTTDKLPIKSASVGVRRHLEAGGWGTPYLDAHATLLRCSDELNLLSEQALPQTWPPSTPLPST